jgi:hypothetical protein
MLTNPLRMQLLGVVLGEIEIATGLCRTWPAYRRKTGA